MRGNFDNSGRLVRFILRRERIMSSLWIIILALFSIVIAPTLGNNFDAMSRQAFVETLKNPGMIALMGPVYGMDNYTVGAMYSNTMLLWVIMAVAVMNIFLVVRHTRGDEEKGRSEVLRSLPTGRLANLHATMITAVAVNVILALVTGLGLAAMRVESMDLLGSMLFGAAIGAAGLFFAAVAAVFAQLSVSSRGAIAYSFVAFGILYFIRAIGDINSETVSLICPLGLIQRSQIYVENHWWPVPILLLETVGVTAIAYALNSIRDIDQGFIPAKPRRKEASVFLRSPFGLSLRLLRNSLIAWFIVMFSLGAAYGSILGDIDTFVGQSEFYQKIIKINEEFSIAKMFITMVTSILSLIGTIPVIIAALKLRSEEKDGRLEHVLSRAVSRTKYLACYVTLAFLASVLFQFSNALGIYTAAASVMPNPSELSLGYLLQANLVYLPALWVMIGGAILLIGLLPKATVAIWGYFGFTFFAAFIGMAAGLPKWLNKLNPFGYIPQLPTDTINFVTLTILTVIAAALTAVGFIFYRKRDMMV